MTDKLDLNRTSKLKWGICPCSAISEDDEVEVDPIVFGLGWLHEKYNELQMEHDIERVRNGLQPLGLH